MPLIFLLPFLGITSAYVYKTVTDETQKTVQVVNQAGPNLIVYAAAGLGLWLAYKAVAK